MFFHNNDMNTFSLETTGIDDLIYWDYVTQVQTCLSN